MKDNKNLKICDDKIVKKACKKNYKYSKSYQSLKQQKINQKNYEKRILHKNRFTSFTKKLFTIIYKIAIIIIALFIILICIALMK